MWTPSVVWRVSVWNQIYSTVYYIARKYIRAKNGGWKPTKDTIGKRGKGESLGMDFVQAMNWAGDFNKDLGWNAQSSCQLPKFKVYF